MRLFTINIKKQKPRSEKFTTHIGTVSLDTTVIFMERQTLSLAINSLKGELTVKVPYTITSEQARKFIKEKEGWLIKKISQGDARRENLSVREYRHGAKHLLLGKEFSLNVVISNRRVAPLFEDAVLTIVIPSEERTEKAVRKWYAKIAPAVFSNIISSVMADFKLRYSKSPSKLEYKFVTSYWGVCTSRGCIRLNIELLRAPKECIEYIIAHELCHLVHQNHSAKFYNLLTEFMPDWKQRKELLNKTITCKY